MQRDCEFSLSSKAKICIYNDLEELRGGDRIEFKKHNASLILSTEEWGEIRKILPSVYDQMRETLDNMAEQHPGLYCRNQQIQFFRLSERTSGLFATQSNLITGETMIVFCLRRLAIESRHGGTSANLFQMTQAQAINGLILDMNEIEAAILKAPFVGDALVRKTAYRYEFGGRTKREADETVSEVAEDVKSFLAVSQPETEMLIVIKHRGRFAPYFDEDVCGPGVVDATPDTDEKPTLPHPRAGTPYPKTSGVFTEKRKTSSSSSSAPTAAPRREKKNKHQPPPDESQASEEEVLQFFDEEDEWTLVSSVKNKKKKQKKQHDISEKETIIQEAMAAAEKSMPEEL